MPKTTLANNSTLKTARDTYIQTYKQAATAAIINPDSNKEEKN